LERLSDEGFPKEHLEEIQRLISAEASDLFDVLEYINYAFLPIERSIRASVARGLLQESMTANEMQFVDFLAAQYSIAGVDELDEPKLQTLLAIKYQSIREGIDRLGSVEVARNIFFKFQEMLYLPHGAYSGPSSAIAS
jgi:type I restriction enzyme R subunit